MSATTIFHFCDDCGGLVDASESCVVRDGDDVIKLCPDCYDRRLLYELRSCDPVWDTDRHHELEALLASRTA
jgi:hypothetical protein